MNVPPKDFKRIAADQLKSFAASCLKAAGLRTDYAEQIAELLTYANLRGVHSHGVRQLQKYCTDLGKKKINPNPNLQVLKETDTAILIDGDGGMGYAPMMTATEKAVAKAKEKGVAVGAACNIGHYGSAGHYVRRAMNENCFAFSVQGSDLRFHSQGRQRRPFGRSGNPPICFGLPGKDEPPVVLDMATRLVGDYQRGEKFDALQEAIPAAFFKSLGLMAVARLLGGPFVNTTRPEATASRKWRGACHGGLTLVLDIGLFISPGEFQMAVDELVREVRDHMEPLRGYDESTLPGALESRHEEQNRRDGVPMSTKDLALLESLARALDVNPLPSSVQSKS